MSFLDVLREGVHHFQEGEPRFEAQAITGKGLESWPASQQDDVQGFLHSLKSRPDLFSAKNNDLVAAVQGLAQQVKTSGTCGLLITDLVQSVKGDGSDATGLGLALADWGKIGGLVVVRFDLPFQGQYYPEAPLGAAYPLRNASRPLYLLVLGPTSAASGDFARSLVELWGQHGQAPESCGLADLTPDLTTRLRVKAELPPRGTSGFKVLPALKPYEYQVTVERSGNRRSFELRASIEGIGLNEVEAALWKRLGSQTAEISPGSLASFRVAGPREAWGWAYDAQRPLKRHGVPDVLALSWSIPATECELPGWVSELSVTKDAPASLLPKGHTLARTLNLEPILRAAQRNIGRMRVATVYLKVEKTGNREN